MNNKEALILLDTETLLSATQTFIEGCDVDISQFERFRGRFRGLTSERDYFRKKGDLSTWEQMLFYPLPTNSPQKKILLQDNTILKINLSHENKKPLSELTLKALRTRLSSLLNLIDIIATKEETDKKTIASYVLQLISNELCDKKVPIVCKVIFRSGTFSKPLPHMPLPKSVFLIDHLQIGKRKYNELRRLLKQRTLFSLHIMTF